MKNTWDINKMLDVANKVQINAWKQNKNFYLINFLSEHPSQTNNRKSTLR